MCEQFLTVCSYITGERTLNGSSSNDAGHSNWEKPGTAIIIFSTGVWWTLRSLFINVCTEPSPKDHTFFPIESN